jgi:imidazolonepropionase-like amidohydrolase
MRLQKQRYMASMAAAIAVTLVGQPVIAATANPQPLIISTGAIFDGTKFIEGNNAVLVQNGKIKQVGPANTLKVKNARVVNIPGGMILPGFIDMHTHHVINQVPPRRMLEHGVTTARDLGSAEPLTPASTNKPYQLRQFLSGPILRRRTAILT